MMLVMLVVVVIRSLVPAGGWGYTYGDSDSDGWSSGCFWPFIFMTHVVKSERYGTSLRTQFWSRHGRFRDQKPSLRGGRWRWHQHRGIGKQDDALTAFFVARR